MNKRDILIFILLICTQTVLFAHSVVLNIADNEDGTIEIFGGFSTGQSAAGAKLIIKSELDSKILYENRIPQSGILTVKTPKEPYKVLLDSGPGHRIEKSGEIKPLDGFDKNSTNKPLNIAYSTSFALCLVFILLSIAFSIKNKKAVKE